MANSDSQVEVRIVGKLDGSVQTSASAAKAQMADLSNASSSLGRTLQQEATAWSAQRQASVGAAESLGEASAAAAGTHGAVSTATREFRALFDELSSGRVRQTPGTLAIIGQRVFGLGPAALASVGGVLALAAGFAYLAERAQQAAQASRDALARSSIADNLVSESGIKEATARLEQMPNVTAAIAQKTVDEFASMRGMTNSILLDLADNVQVFAQTIAKPLPEAAAQLREFMEAPAQNGAKFIDAIGASADQVRRFVEAAKLGNAQALSAGLEIFTQQMVAADQKAGDLKRRMDETRTSVIGVMTAGDEFGTSVPAAMKAADEAAAKLGSTVRSQQGADLARAMRDAAQASATLPPSLDQIRAKIEEIGAESGRTRSQVVEDQIAYLNSALSAAEKASASAEAQDQIETMLAEKKVQLAGETASATIRATNQEKAAALEAVQAEIAATVEGTGERLEAVQRYYDKAVQLYGAESKQAENGQRQLTTARSQLAAEWLSDLIDVEQQAIGVTNASAKQQSDAIKQLYQEKQISAQQEIALLAGIEADRHQLIQNELASELAEAAGQPEKLKAINDQIAAEQITHQSNMGAIVRQGATEIAQEYETAWAPITSGFDRMVDGILSGNQTLVQAIARGAETMAEDWIRQELRLVEQSIIGDQARVAAHNAANSGMVVSDTATAGEQSGITLAKYGAQIMADAGKAYADVFAWASPELGPFAAVPAAAAYAAVAAKAALIPSFDVGTNFVPNDMIAQIHQGERIIPAADNSDLMGALDGGSNDNDVAQEGDIHLHFDGMVVQTGMSGNPQVVGRKVVDAISGEIRNGNTTLRRAVQGK